MKILMLAILKPVLDSYLHKFFETQFFWGKQKLRISQKSNIEDSITHIICNLE